MLPDIDGLTLCRHLRQLTPYIPILMLSARDGLSDKVVGLELGADEYVTKPFEPRELLARVRAMLRFAGQRTAGQGLEEQPLVCGPVTLWKAQHRVEVNGQPVELTPTEWALLELLVAHPGQVFGRETLLNRIWGCNFLGDSRTVDVHMQRLRAKFESCMTAPGCIQTVRGFGYRFVSIDGEETMAR
jgi:DNA-binding response OmpR family regulator